MEHKFKEKEIVAIVTTNALYTTYEKIVPQKYAKQWVSGAYPKKNQPYKIVALLKHEWDRLLYLIQDIETKQVYVIGEDGVEKNGIHN